MRKIIPLFTLVLMLAACGGSSNQVDKLNGEWAVDVKSVVENTPELKEAYAQAPEVVNAMLKEMSATFDVPGKKMTLKLGTIQDTGTFTVVSESGNKVVLANEQQEKVIVEFSGDDKIVLMPENEPTAKVIFIRKK